MTSAADGTREPPISPMLPLVEPAWVVWRRERSERRRRKLRSAAPWLVCVAVAMLFGLASYGAYWFFFPTERACDNNVATLVEAGLTDELKSETADSIRLLTWLGDRQCLCDAAKELMRRRFAHVRTARQLGE